MFFFDPVYLLFLAPAMLLSMWAAWATRSRFARWSAVPNRRRISGAQVARFLLDRNGLAHVAVVPARGTLSDHYDPTRHVVRLSEDVYYGGSVAAIAVAAHETGHAIQHGRGYLPLALRSAAVPLANVGSSFSFGLLFLGLLLSASPLIWAGVLLFSGTVLFQLITLPVELDASRRAKAELERFGLVTPGERRGVSAVLGAAAMTYVGAAISGVMTLAYFLFRLGALGPQRS